MINNLFNISKFYLLLAILLSGLCSFAYTEEHYISQVTANGEIIIMDDGSIYKVYSYDASTSNLWLPLSNVVVTSDKIINVDDGETVDYERRIR